jgi:hypothetical protein
MRTIYVDSEKKCHLSDDGTMTPVETSFFDGKCDAFVEGYCYDIKNKAIYPWKDLTELDKAQRKYEQSRLADAENALAILLGGVV